MTYLEYYETIKAFGIADICSWKDLTINFSNTYYTIVKGKIPLEVASIIAQKYPNNQYHIRVAGGCEDWKPNEWATSTENGDKYIETYHIDTKEGLLIFLEEMKDYYLRKNNLPETEVEKYDESIAQITSEIIRKVNPSISASDWMQENAENRDTYNLSVERDTATTLGQKLIKAILGEMLREAISDFDKAVNPFLDDSVELDEVSNYLQKVEIRADSYDSEYGKSRSICFHLEITDIDTKNKTAYYRSSDGFSFQLEYNLGDKQYLHVLHYFSTTGNYESDKGEVIAINYFGDNSEVEIDLRLNITNGKAGKTYEDKIPATLEQITFVYDELLKAIDYASSITIENMKKKANTKSYK